MRAGGRRQRIDAAAGVSDLDAQRGGGLVT